MHQRKLVWKALKQAGVLDSDDTRLQELVQFLREHPNQCWEEIIPEFRKRFYDCFDAVVPVLAEIDDPLIQTTLVKYADLNKSKEKKILAKMAKEVSVERHAVPISRMAKLKVAEVNKALHRRSLPEHLRAHIEKK